MSKKDVLIKLNNSDLRAALKKMLRSEHSELISDVIIANLTVSEVGMEHLFLAMSGVRKTFKFKVFDYVLVKYGDLATWRMDKQKMEEAGLITNGFVSCMITVVNPTLREPYTISYNYLDSSGKKGTDTYQNTGADFILNKATEVLEDLNNNTADKDELPF